MISHIFSLFPSPTSPLILSFTNVLSPVAMAVDPELMAQDPQLDLNLIKSCLHGLGSQVPLLTTLLQCQATSNIAQIRQQVDGLPERLERLLEQLLGPLMSEFKKLEGKVSAIKSFLLKT